MASFVKNLGTAASDPVVMLKYLQWAAAGMGSGQRIIGIDGARIGGFPNFSSYLGAWRNRITSSEAAYLKRHIKPGATVFDVGANWGVFSLHMAGLVGPSGKVYSFEPAPATFAALQENLARNQGEVVDCYNCAVGAEPGEVRFTNSRDPATNRIDAQGEISIALDSLDVFCAKIGVTTIDFIKIDVEGAELDVIAGAKGLFTAKAITTGMIEVCPGNLRAFGADIGDLYDAFADVGYCLYWLEDPDTVLSRDDFVNLPDSFLGNAGFRAKA